MASGMIKVNKMKFIKTVFGPSRKERRAASSEARSNKVTSASVKRMSRPGKQEMLANGYLKLDTFFQSRIRR